MPLPPHRIFSRIDSDQIRASVFHRKHYFLLRSSQMLNSNPIYRQWRQFLLSISELEKETRMQKGLAHSSKAAAHCRCLRSHRPLPHPLQTRMVKIYQRYRVCVSLLSHLRLLRSSTQANYCRQSSLLLEYRHRRTLHRRNRLQTFCCF